MAITKRLVKGSALTQTELDANFTHVGGDGTYQFPSTKGTTKQILRMNSGATALEYATVDSDEVNEGSANQYFTNARADARINALVTKSFVDTLYASAYIQGNFQVRTSSYNADAAVNYMVDTTGGVVTATLPASPAAGDTIRFTNGAENFATNNLVIARNGNNIDGTASDVTLTSNPSNGILTLIHDGASWRQR